jgi:signal transduction histidine kinase
VARRGLLAEVVASLALVMLAAATVLALLLIQHNESRLRDLLGRALLAEARGQPATLAPLVPGTLWWRVDAHGGARAAGAATQPPIDAEGLALAARTRESRETLVQPGAPWAPIRFAAPAPNGDAWVARVPPNASFRLRAAPLALVAGLLVVDVAVFTAFGASLLRRRVVAPLARLADATRELAEGGFAARLPVTGPREAAAVAEAWNAMSEALAKRTAALEKAVVDLREANAALRVAQSGLDRAQRLAAVGRLAAGVAHEVGNPMAALLAFLDLVGRDPGLREDSRRHLARAAEQGDRVRRILRQLLEFSRPPRMDCVPLDLGALAEETVALVHAQRRYAGVRFEVVREGAPPNALADPSAVAQILLNLVVNAADAVVQEGGNGAVQVCVRAAALALRGGADAAAASTRRAPDGVECCVADQGAGIAEGDRERLFDPFFTTKPPGEGTGLGLANSQRLAEELSGALELVEAPEGFRTGFVLRLVAERPASACAVRSGMRSGTREGDTDRERDVEA